jgi:ring-1,2-phenylacetyl-CoA epoxidase subunit PaaD
MTLATPIASHANTPSHSVVEEAWALLESLTDPEIPVVTLRELGILRDVRMAHNAEGTEQLEVVITPTYSGCPAMGQIEDDVRNLLKDHGLQGRVVTKLAPAWTTDWMTPEAKDKLRAYGIAPPHSGADHDCLTHGGKDGSGDNTSIVQFAARSASNPGRHELLAVACPQCGSDNTTETSHFGSTACKALYRCLDCMEPFDYFKPY